MTEENVKTEIIALGTGGAFTKEGYQTNFIIRRRGKNLLIDCGSDIRHSLDHVGLTFKDIDAIYVSHAHADHIGGMEFLGFLRYFTSHLTGLPRPKLFCERSWIRDLWDRSLRGGMESVEGIDCTLETFFEPCPVERNSCFIWDGLEFDIVQSLHVSARYAIVDSFGLMFNDDIDGRRIYITTDVQFAPETAMKAYYREADFIIHDCETAYTADGDVVKCGVHAHYSDLKTLPDKIKKKIHLVHYGDNVILNFDTWQERALEDGFAGFLKPGVVYETIGIPDV